MGRWGGVRLGHVEGLSARTRWCSVPVIVVPNLVVPIMVMVAWVCCHWRCHRCSVPIRRRLVDILLRITTWSADDRVPEILSIAVIGVVMRWSIGIQWLVVIVLIILGRAIAVLR